MHKVAIPEHVIGGVIRRRGRLNPFDSLDGPSTALLVVDLQNAFMLPGMVVEVATAREIVPNVNRLAESIRDAGGKVVFLKMTITEADKQDWSVYYNHFTHPDHRADEVASMTRGHPGHELYAGLVVRVEDLIVEKNRFSAFIQGSSDLDAILKRHNIDTVIVTGAVTNVCCEATARDAMMLNYKTVFVSDANAARSDDDHNASLAAVLRVFAAVHSTDEVIALLRSNHQVCGSDSPPVSARRAAG
jgi:ureidoacrylate peracid hydrolase